VFDSLSLSYSLCILLRFTELIFALESIQLSSFPSEYIQSLERLFASEVHPELEKL